MKSVCLSVAIIIAMMIALTPFNFALGQVAADAVAADANAVAADAKIDDAANREATAPPASQPTADPKSTGDAKSTAEAKSIVDPTSIGGMIVSGGTMNIAFFGVLGLFSVWSAAVVLERMVHLRREKILPHAFTSQLTQVIQSRSVSADRLRLVCESGQAPACRILRAAAIRAGRPLNEIEKAMEDTAAREMAMLRGKHRPLNVVGNIAPLVGLLGTVVGMIMAFQISSHQGLGKAEQLAEGIYLALMTTAAGLTIAIPCLLFAAWFQARGEKLMCEVADTLTETLPCFAALEGRSSMGSNQMDRGATVRAGHATSETTISERTEQDQHSDPPRRQGQQELTVRERFLRDGVFEPLRG